MEDNIEDYIRNKYKGYHIDIDIFPSGGIISAYGCEECGTEEKFTACKSWKLEKGQSLNTAMEDLSIKIKDEAK